MEKNIVLCSDGTGNKGGSGSDTNVFKVYDAVQINDIGTGERPQIAFYDNGVGTSKLNLQRAFGGGLGLGFRQNVRDLYEYLGRNYSRGDDIYMFGFSRGAATVRAFAGMLEHCGLVVQHRPDPESDLDESTFQAQVDAAMAYYVRRSQTKKLGFDHGEKVTVEFLGIWDTVSALGMPQLPWLDDVVNLFRRHKFYDYEPATCVRNVYHAIAVDDQRRTFWPKVWNEEDFKGGGTIEQVWFPGMHSNVGGGYPREELSNVALDWMMQKLESHCARLRAEERSNRGLCLNRSPRDDARAGANPTGKLYDSRGGFAIYYRYQPRPIEVLCGDSKTPIRMHTSVLDRLERRTAGYTPGNLPGAFEEASTPAVRPSPRPGVPCPENDTVLEDRPSSGEPHQLVEPASKPVSPDDYTSVRAAIDLLKNGRIALYWVFLMSSLAVTAASAVLWLQPPPAGPTGPADAYAAWQAGTPVLHWVEAGLRYILPTFFDGTITYLLIQHPSRLVEVLAYAVFLYGIRVLLQMAAERREELARGILLRLHNRVN